MSSGNYAHAVICCDCCTDTTVRRTLILPSISYSPAALEPALQTITEQQLTLFKFYLDQVVHEGMVYGKALYQRAKQFRADELLEAHQYGCVLMAQGVPALMSVSTQRYIVWTRLGVLEQLL